MKRIPILLFLVLLLPAVASAQVPGLTGPDASPEASVSQTIGLTVIDVAWHRPAVNGRAVWGGLVPYDLVWRAGANENTVVSFSTPVTVNGAPLAAGEYGLHMIPTTGEWTVIFSRQSKAWGSFTYDEKEDAARVKVTPVAADHMESLAYSFDDPKADSVVLALRWEKLRVPVEIRIDRAKTVMDDFRTQLRGLPQFGWQGWNQAANWALQNNLDLDEALLFSERSLARGRNFTNLRTRADIVEKRGQADEAKALRAEAMEVATEAEVNTYGYQLLGQQKVDEAIAIFLKNTKDHPESWNTFDSLAEAYGVKGDRKKAIEYYTKALGMTNDPAQKTRITAAIEQLKR